MERIIVKGVLVRKFLRLCQEAALCFVGIIVRNRIALAQNLAFSLRGVVRRSEQSEEAESGSKTQRPIISLTESGKCPGWHKEQRPASSKQTVGDVNSHSRREAIMAILMVKKRTHHCHHGDRARCNPTISIHSPLFGLYPPSFRILSLQRAAFPFPRPSRPHRNSFGARHFISKKESLLCQSLNRLNHHAHSLIWQSFRKR